jgi:hypothetical protein
MRTVAIIAASLALAACAEPINWTKDGASSEDYRRDAYECERDTRMASHSFNQGILFMRDAERFARKCMGAKGYTPSR